MQWWCSAQTSAWDWTWTAYPGVWILMLLLTAAYVRILRSAARSDVPDRPDEPGRPGRRLHRAWAGAAGLALLWIALDWPVGALGAGYLASVHMLQFLLLALVGPALLLLGVPAEVWRRLEGSWLNGRAFRFLTHPLVALATFNAVLLFTHMPSVVDGLMPSQLGSFGIDMLWLLSGLVFWWPIVVPVPARPRFVYPLQMGYLILATVLNTMPYAFLTFGKLPFYGIYELSPPVSGVTAREDQQIAGLLMKMGGGVVLWTAITALFFRWHAKEDAADDDRGEETQACHPIA